MPRDILLKSTASATAAPRNPIQNWFYVMKLPSLLAVCALAGSPLTAEETRQLDAHEHGVGQLDIAFDGNQIAMELHAPGADIVGFEYAAESAADVAAVKAALGTLATPSTLFVIPAAAGCGVTQASAALEAEEAHEEHDHEDHDGEHKDEHAHEDHDDEHKDEHAHEDHDDEHKDEHKDDHAHEDHDDDHKDEHAHEDHESAEGHTEFHATYLLSCTNPSEATSITFAYFDLFPNAQEVEVQLISDKGATAFEVERDAPVLDLSSAL